MGKKLCDVLGEFTPVILLLVVQVALAGVIIFYKLAVIDGMSMRIVIAYRLIFASATVIPLALILERERKAKLTWKVVFQASLAGLFGGALAPNLLIASVYLTSATIASALGNLIPITTFILAVILRVERLRIRTLEGQAKLAGTLLSIGGAMVLAFYKGQEINLWSTNVNLAKNGGDHVTTKHEVLGNQVLGSMLGLASSVSFAIWFIILAKMGETYPLLYSSTALQCIAASIQATIYSLIAERNWSAWKLGWNIRLLTAVYTGAIGTTFTVVLMSWCVQLKGPLFVSIFNPLQLVFVGIVGYLILNEKLTIGSILGSVMIILGVYAVLWGKAKEQKTSAAQQAPLADEQPKESKAVEVVIQDTKQSCDQATQSRHNQ